MWLPTAGVRSLLERGVYKAPWKGPNGEIVLIAVTSTHSLVTVHPIVVPLGADHVAAADELWDMLIEMDPEPEYLARRRTIRII